MSAAHSAIPFTNCPQNLCIPHLLEVQAARTPDAIAIAAPGRTPLTYSRLWRHIDEVVKTLQAIGVDRNDRIALVLPNGPEMAVAFLAIAASATSAPLNPDCHAAELDFYLSDLNAKMLIMQSGIDSPARAVAQARGIPILELSPVFEAEAGLFTLTGYERAVHTIRHGLARSDDVGLLLHTSGTTSRPKIVPLTHINLCTSAINNRAAFELVARDCCLNMMPLFHIGGLMMMLSSLLVGASVVCPPGFYAPRFFEWLNDFHPTWYMATPPMHQVVLTRAASHQAIIEHCPLRFIRSGSAPLSPQVLAELERVFNAPVIDSYGLTETTALITSNPLPPRERKLGSVGVTAGPDVAIMDEAGNLLPPGETGEIVIRGATVMRGYEKNPAANAVAFRHGWFRTGDQGYLDPDGYLFLTGRLKELINRGGEKISPREIEEVLLGHPAVAQAVIFAVPHAQLGEEVAAAIVLRENGLVTDREIRAFAAARLVDFKVPYQVVFVDEIPKGVTGKVQRAGLAQRLRLLSPRQEQPEVNAKFTVPRTSVEEMLVGIWSEVLGVECVGIHDNFFELGGHSLLATQLMSRLHEVFRVELPLRSMLEAPTVAALAEHIETIRWALQGFQAPCGDTVSDREEGEL
jgi:acyl-CoA synthetase (AMP-forming)/AMP-acid ligase II/acyl carrier protein